MRLPDSGLFGLEFRLACRLVPLLAAAVESVVSRTGTIIEWAGAKGEKRATDIPRGGMSV